MRLNKTALHSYITKSNSHQVTYEDINKYKYGNKTEIGLIYFLVMETNREVFGMFVNVVKQVNMNQWVH